jgi:hypothetical protein
MSTLPTPSRAALIGFAIFVGASLLGGEDFPFTRQALSTNAFAEHDRSRTVVLLRIRVDGERVDMGDYERFDGLTDSLKPLSNGHGGIAPLVSRKFLSALSKRAIQRVFLPIDESRLQPGDAAGPHSVELGLEIHHITPSGKKTPIWVPLQRGTAWPAS